MLAALTVRRAGSDRGFTLVEVTIILLVLVIISMIMLPQLGNFNRLARKVKVYEDLGAICATMKKFLDEVMLPGPFGQPGGACTNPDGSVCALSPRVTPVNPVGLLAGPGLAPNDVVNTVAGAGQWDLAIGAAGQFSETPDIFVNGTLTSTLFRTQSMESHLQYNRTGGTNAALRYPNQKDDPSIGAFMGWRGPYFDMITPDPWGSRYMVNTFALHRDSDGNTFSSPVICYSAGANILAETVFNQPHPAPYAVGGDDIAVVLSAFGPF